MILRTSTRQSSSFQTVCSCERWWFQWRFWFVPSVPGYLREEGEHKPDTWRYPIERNNMGLHLEKEVARRVASDHHRSHAPTIISNNPVFSYCLGDSKLRIKPNSKLTALAQLSFLANYPNSRLTFTLRPQFSNSLPCRQPNFARRTSGAFHGELQGCLYYVPFAL